MAVNGVAPQLTNLIDRFSALRTGVVLTAGAEFATVEFSTSDAGDGVEQGETIRVNAAYLRGLVPAPGDTVALIRQGATWLVLGTTTASGQNLVQNASFEDSAGDGSVPQWFFYNVTDTVSWTADESGNAAEGLRVLEGQPDTATATGMAYSGPIGVLEGQTVQLGAYAGGLYPVENQALTVDVQLRALWFANAVDLYPTTAAADTTVASITDIASGDDHLFPLFGTAVVPAGVPIMRVGLRAVLGPDAAGVQFDAVTARVLES